MPTAMSAKPFKSLKIAININPRECDFVPGICQSQSASIVQTQLYRPLASPCRLLRPNHRDAHFEYDTDCTALQLRAVGHYLLAEIAGRRILNRRCDTKECIGREDVARRTRCFQNSHGGFCDHIASHVIVVALNENVRISAVEHAILLNAVAISKDRNVFENAG